MGYASVYFEKSRTGGDKIHLIDYDENGKKRLTVEDYQSYCYVPAKDGEYKDLFGKRCKRKEFDSYYDDQRPYIKDHLTYEGDVAPEDRFLIDRYHDKDIISNIPNLHVHTIDIETDSAGGFPQAGRITDEILLMTVYSSVTKKYHMFGQKDYTPTADNVEYNYCEDERILLKTYFKWHIKNFPDIITGWNSIAFDIPYILDRTLHYSKTMFRRYSPFNNVRETQELFENRMIRVYDIAGITQLDYLRMYKEFSINESESYTLNHIAHVELGEEKVKFDGTLFTLWKTDWPKYCEYNLKDVELVKKFDDKLAFIGLVQVQAYICRVPLKRVKSAIRKFDSYLITILKDKKIVLPTVERKTKEHIIGGFVSEPHTGFFPWVTSFDFTSLYPHIIFSLNLSPETYVATIKDDVGQSFTVLDIESISDESEYLIVDRKNQEKNVFGSKLKSWIRKKKYILSPNGLLFKPEEGFIPKVVQEVFQKRKDYKNTMLTYEKKYEETKDIPYKDLAHKYYLYQYAMKIFANSIYGIMANENFRFFNPEFARAITLTGRKVIQYTASNVNEFFSENFSAKGDMVLYCDTDSIYVDYQPIMDHFEINANECVQDINDFNDEYMEPLFDKIFDDFSKKLLGADKNWFHLKRESIATGSIFVMKKKYACRVIDDEGTTYDEPKLKVKGMEIVRSSTPSFCRDKIKNIVNLMIDTMDKKLIMEEIRKIRKEFLEEDLINISFPRGVKAIKKWLNGTKLISGCPIHVRAAINYNKLLKEYGLEDNYDEIQEGTKIKFVYIKEDNSSIRGQNILGFPDVLPPEYGLDEFIDMDLQFEKSFMSPIQTLCEAVSWGRINIYITDLDEFF